MRKYRKMSAAVMRIRDIYNEVRSGKAVFIAKLSIMKPVFYHSFKFEERLKKFDDQFRTFSFGISDMSSWIYKRNFKHPEALGQGKI